MDEELVGDRLTELRATVKQLRVRRDELTHALDDEPTAPDPATLTKVADHITEIITSGTHNQAKALVEAFVAQVTITGPDRLIPVFRIPQPNNTNGAATAPTAETAPKAVVRTMTKSVDLTCQHKNQTLLVEGPEIMIRPIGTRPQSMRGRFSTDQLQTMIDFYKSGATAEQVAQACGFSKRSVKRLLQQHGVRRERRNTA
ncbi:MAG: hypothetical protein ACRDQU_20835 [Pseudonocardiaceae bacterium]